MKTGVSKDVEESSPARITNPDKNNKRLLEVAANIAGWLDARLATGGARTVNARTRRARVVAAGAIIFTAALGVRFFHWHDSYSEIEGRNTEFMKLGRQYKQEARRMQEEGILFPREHDPGDARMLLHPPGYPILMLAIYGREFEDHLFNKLRLIQVICDAAAAVAVLLIAFELLPLAVAIIAGLLVALSPHFAYHSLWFTPDTLAILPILVAVYLIIRAMKRPRIITVIAAGAMMGLSCWLRSNGLLLAPVLAVVMLVVFERGQRLRYAAAMVAAAAMVISPITIRNWVVFDCFIPISVDAGMAMVQGIANYDKEGRFGMPVTGQDVVQKDIEWSGRADYAGNLWMPDGIERDRERFARGLAVARSNPSWFARVMIRRAAFMLRYNEPGAHDWPISTATVPAVLTGPWHSVWTRYARALIRGLQKNLFTTLCMLPTVMIGIAMLALAGRGNALAILVAVPAYYLCVHSAIHTEYRYILAIHYFLFIAAAVAYYCLGLAIVESARGIMTRVNPRLGLSD